MTNLNDLPNPLGDREAYIDTDQILEAGRAALHALLITGKDRVVRRNGRILILRPEDDGYWENSGAEPPKSGKATPKA